MGFAISSAKIKTDRWLGEERQSADMKWLGLRKSSRNGAVTHSSAREKDTAISISFHLHHDDSTS